VDLRRVDREAPSEPSVRIARSFVNGIGAICLTLLCLTGAVVWWPGVKNWRRSLTVSWGSQFPRINWDLHSALGFRSFLFVLLWGISGIYFAFPQWFTVLLLLDPADRVTDQGLFWLSELHFWKVRLVYPSRLGRCRSGACGVGLHWHFHLLSSGDL
jgi:hypothetical protein